MRNYFIDFLDRFSYPEESRPVLTDALDKIYDNENTSQEFQALLSIYDQDMNYNHGEMKLQMHEIAQKAGIHEYTGNLVWLICLSKRLKEYYTEAGLSEDIWFNSMCDLRYKLVECKEVYNIWGTFVPDWFGRFYKLDRFAFGKLQFEPIYLKTNYKKGDIVLDENSTVINVHIPRTGTKLDRESMKASYAAAAEFYKEKFNDTSVIFACHSWLLFPKNKELLSETSNLYAFISDYDVFESGEYEDYKEVWRLFDTNYDGNVEHLPQNTSFRRGYADWIRNNVKIGWGYGVYVYNK